MVKITFGNSKGEERFIAQVPTKAQVVEAIFCFVRECKPKFLEQNNYEPFYVRSYVTTDGRTKYDVGSHTEFFYAEEVAVNV